MTDFAAADLAAEQVLGYQTDPAAQYGDSNLDGVSDTVSVLNPDGTTSVFVDQDQDGGYEGAVVFRADGTAAVTMVDADQNGAYESAAADQSGDGVADVYVTDTNLDGVLDSRVDDANQNGVADLQEPGGAAMPGDFIVGGPEAGAYTDGIQTVDGPGYSVVGPVTNPDPVYQLIMDLAAETGTVAFGPSDSDADGWYEDEDARPSDPFYR
jgi:hypothetical protein